ncbi:MAG: ABC transporter substrate-binding protein [Thermoleophilia bacterium]
MRRRWRTIAALAVLALCTALVAASCGGDDDEGTSSNGGGGGTEAAQAGPIQYSEPQVGGTYRMATTDFGFTDAFDPTGEYLGSAWNTMNNLLLRTLVTYRFTAGAAGNELVPDLATAIPEAADGGKSYTFTLKDGVKFGPPINREITSKDILYAFKRIGTPSLAAQYGFYYNEIEGMQDFADGKSDEISGITTPDDKTITFTLTKAVGDFPYRLAMPATAPIPEEVGKCFTQAGEYGRYVISSGPYMFEGSGDLKTASCDAMKPISGFNPTSKMNLVRNPNYDQATDEIRSNYPDRFEFTINTNEQDIFDKISAGELESSYDQATPDVMREYLTGDNADRLRINGGDRTWYIFMNLTQPPFDDVNVRKAMNSIMDLEGLQRAWGGPTSGQVATHILPTSLINGQLQPTEYSPYQSAPFAGDEEKAKEFMKQSKYDTDQDGVCDAPECKGILMMNRNYGAWAQMTPVIQQSAAKIGIGLDIREQPTGAAYTAIQTTARNFPTGANAGWGKDYADPSTFMVLFDGRNIAPTGNTNYSLVGLTAGQVKELGVKGVTTGIPNVDADIDACVPLTGEERMTCWVNLDKKLTEEVVPWVPYLDAANADLVGPAVTNYDYDQNAGEQALAHVAVDPSLQK